jgi:hypothetical protein
MTKLHCYGQTTIKSEFCEKCQQEAFIIGGKFSCCGKSIGNPEHQQVIYELQLNARRKIPKKWLRKRILDEQNNRCLYCGVEFGTWEDGKQITVEWDHIKPHCYTGANYEFAAACGRCNRAKAGKVFDSIREVVNYVREKCNL